SIGPASAAITGGFLLTAESNARRAPCSGLTALPKRASDSELASSQHNLMGASTRRCPGGHQVWRYSSVTVWRGVCLTHQRRHKHEREGTPSLNTEVRRRLRSARPPAHPG